ncbi:acyl-CoA dehydrogenase [Aureimonas altamirensis]|uniref:3-methylmercaptopropionyl-CoA dehydrogenase n=1 Tax=Aureimonas altamirensis TaxID=370622 RepID=A0A0B1QAZ4_9HYPH|nr:acyl-CoA dehydrogenase [Aureimonas altamirensis]KHJ56005.1 acyl-CoA dehydrogenase [Aureimonas altamirensis]
MYKAPVSEIGFTLRQVIGLDDAMGRGKLGDLTPDLLDAILEEAGRYAGDAVAPLYESGDRIGAQFDKGVVTMPPGWGKLYTDWCAAGWNALTGPVEAGGQGLPTALSAAVTEMWNGASMAFGIGPTLTIAAVEALHKHGSEALKAIYLEKLTSGEWTGTMQLTEPQSGSDLSGLRTRAERRDDGTYRLFGQKIFITFGEHDMTDNIVHIILARLPDAPAGVKGISMFLVPKFIPDADGRPGLRNDAFCVGMEHKLGIHASPTCTMVYGDNAGETGEAGAVAWLVGEENKGLACMFTMMNSARLYVGVQGLGVAEAATQKALAYAKDRRQGRARDGGEGMVPIIQHPDVRRMLMTMKALTAAARAICYSCAFAIDMSHAEDGAEAARWADRASVLTPMAKSFATDIGVEVASMGVQVHGGMGFIEETGAARLLRDARIAPIYEGTNGIQAMDLVMRKLPLGGGAAVDALLAEIEADIDAVETANRPGIAQMAEGLREALDDLRDATFFLRQAGVDDALAGATAYQRLFSLVLGGSLMARAALRADEGTGHGALARFMVADILPETRGLNRKVKATGRALESVEAALA